MNNNAKNVSVAYPLMSAPFRIGSLELPNRVVFPTWHVNYANADGTISPELHEFYARLADGGCGLVFVGVASVSPEGNAFERVVGLHHDDFIPGLTKVVAMIKEKNAVAGVQIVHYGRQSSSSLTGGELLTPSGIPCPIMSQYDPEYKAREMTVEEIHTLRDQFIDAAERAAESGAQVVEVHAAHGYMLSQFMSPYSNKRTDQYGGSMENRCRIVVEILKGIRKRLKDRIVVSVRINGNDFVEGGLVPDDYEAIIPLLEKAGMDWLNVSAGVYESMTRIVPPKDMGIAPHVDIAARLKSFATVPVCTVGSILTMETAESIVAEGKADLVAMGRAQVADPAIAGKSFRGELDKIRKCIHCNSCTFWTTGDPQMYCVMNPDYQKPK